LHSRKAAAYDPKCLLICRFVQLLTRISCFRLGASPSLSAYSKIAVTIFCLVISLSLLLVTVLFIALAP
jgi:hypothetical protein